MRHQGGLATEAGHAGPRGHERAFGFDSKARKPLMHSKISNICFVFLKAHSGCSVKGPGDQVRMRESHGPQGRRWW